MPIYKKKPTCSDTLQAQKSYKKMYPPDKIPYMKGKFSEVSIVILKML